MVTLEASELISPIISASYLLVSAVAADVHLDAHLAQRVDHRANHSNTFSVTHPHNKLYAGIVGYCDLVRGWLLTFKVLAL